MEYYTIEQDIQVATMKADRFPEGIIQAHRQLHALLPEGTGREYYGISHPLPSGEILYMAAATVGLHEQHKLKGTETFTIRRGIYLTEILQDFARNPDRITEAFQRLISAPNIDSAGYCLEWYYNERDCRCMVPLK